MLGVPELVRCRLIDRHRDGSGGGIRAIARMQDDRFGMLAIHAHNFLRGPSGLWHTLAESSPAWTSDATGRLGQATTPSSRPGHRPPEPRSEARGRTAP